MLTNEQIDQMEQMIYFAEPDEVMEVLSKLIPVLFAELRITRGTLDSKVSQFLGEVNEQHLHPRMREMHRQIRNLYVNNRMSIRAINKAFSHSLTAREVMEILRPLVDQKKNKENLLPKEELEEEGSDKKFMDTRTGKAEIRRAGEGVRRSLLESEASEMWQ